VSDSCSASAAAEPLAGTAPTETHLLVVEAPGRWSAEPLRDCSLPEPERRALADLPSHWRVILGRRPDRPLRRQRDRFVWLSTPERPARRWQLPVDAPVVPDRLPGPGLPVSEPTLLLCTNGARDRCCALLARPLLDRLASTATWECSHLGGHRFAPTALRLPDRVAFGRLSEAAAQQVLAGRMPLASVRGPVGWPPDVQAATVAVWQHHRVSPLLRADVDRHRVLVRLQDGSAWQVAVSSRTVPARLKSCGTDQVPGNAPHAGVPVPLVP
jgi:hypothetical protein